jgi:hypothetical protein
VQFLEKSGFVKKNSGNNIHRNRVLFTIHHNEKDDILLGLHEKTAVKLFATQNVSFVFFPSGRQ